MKRWPDHSGNLMVEGLISIAVLMLFSLGLSNLAIANGRAVDQSAAVTRAVNYARQTMEQVVAVKHQDWHDLADMAPAANYRVTNISGSWQLQAAPAEDLGEGYQRRIAIDEGRRRSGQLDQAGSDPDPLTRFVTVTVEWVEDGVNKNYVLHTYLTNWKGQ